MKVFIVEDSKLVCKELLIMLSGIPGISVTGQAADEDSAIEAIGSLLPDAVILDLHLQNGSGFNVLKNIKRCHPETTVIVLSNYAMDSYISLCRQAGADFFFDKSFQFRLVGEVLEQLNSPGEVRGERGVLQ